jgi:hypothetical protein
MEIGRSKEFVWDAIRDVGAIHKRLVPGFVVNCVLEDGARTAMARRRSLQRIVRLDCHSGFLPVIIRTNTSTIAITKRT